MKNVIKLLMLTLMLKVWWHEHELWGPAAEHVSYYMNAASPENNSIFVKDLNGGFHWVQLGDITEVKWVEVKVVK